MAPYDVWTSPYYCHFELYKYGLYPPLLPHFFSHRKSDLDVAAHINACCLCMYVCMYVCMYLYRLEASNSSKLNKLRIKILTGLQHSCLVPEYFRLTDDPLLLDIGGVLTLGVASKES